MNSFILTHDGPGIMNSDNVYIWSWKITEFSIISNGGPGSYCTTESERLFNTRFCSNLGCNCVGDLAIKGWPMVGHLQSLFVVWISLWLGTSSLIGGNWRPWYQKYSTLEAFCRALYVLVEICAFTSLWKKWLLWHGLLAMISQSSGNRAIGGATTPAPLSCESSYG